MKKRALSRLLAWVLSLCLVSGLLPISVLAAELGNVPTVVATGGMAQFIAPLCRREMKVEKDLLLKGLNAIYKKNRKEAAVPKL